MSMEIRIQCTDGEISSFAMSDERRSMDLVESIKPSAFFEQPSLRIQAGKRTSIFIMKEIESIFFATSIEVKTREQPPAKNFRPYRKRNIGRSWRSSVANTNRARICSSPARASRRCLRFLA